MTEVCGRYVIVSADEVIENACLVFNERIVRIEKERGIRDNTIVTHGLTSIHTHLGLYPIRTTLTGYMRLDDWVTRYVWRWEKFLRKEPELSYATAVLALSKVVLSGVTAVADMHFNEDKVAEALLKVGIRGDLSVAIMSRGVYDSFEVAMDENVELAKKYGGSSLIKIRLGPTTPRLLSPHEFKEVVDKAKEMGIGIHTHIAEVPEDARFIREAYGMSMKDFIEFVELKTVNTIIAHGVWLDPETELALAHPNITIAHCPTSNTLLRDGVAPIKKYLDKGIRVGLGIDVSLSYSILDEITAATYLHLGRGDLGPREMLYLATVAGYQALGIGKGIIEVGETADIVLWSIDEPAIDPVIGLIASGRVTQAYVGGRKIVEEGHILGVSSEEIGEFEKEVLRYFKKCFTA
ncbi:MAG: amidohydrolase family protein [Sulfolobales archaeon]